MYVDRYRFAKDPSAFQVAQRSPLKDLANGYRRKLRDIATLLKNGPDIVRVHNAFADKASRATFRDLLVYRYLTPHFSHVANNEVMFNDLEFFMQEKFPNDTWSSHIDIIGEPVKVWSIRYNDIPVKVATIKYGLYWTLISQQYYFRRGSTFVGPEPGDVVLDCGSCLGDTALKFAAHVGETGKVYGFDPVPTHIRIARENVARNHFDDRVEIFACGVAEQSRPNVSAAIQGHGATDGNLVVSPGRHLSTADATISIDDFCRFKDLDAVDYIKMDIEGSEGVALEGAHQTISRFRPKLAICLYHKPSDLWTIPSALKKRYPFYRIYLEHHSLHAEETVLYAIDEREDVTG